MTVTLTSPVLGQAVDSEYTGSLEGWLLAHGYAKQAGYTGVGVSETGVTDVAPADDLNLAENRESADWGAKNVEANIANDPDSENSKQPFDYDQGGVDDDAPQVASLEPAEGLAAGGTEVRVYGDNLEGVTSVTFGAVAGTALDVVSNGELTVVTPPHAAGQVDVVFVDADGNETLAGGFTYLA